jgi:DNA replication protein DnaC
MHPPVGDWCLGNQYRNAHMARIEQDQETVAKMHAWTGNPKSICYFCGNVGTGKTYFAAAWYNLLKEQKKHVRIFTEQLLFSHLMSCMDHKIDPHFEMSRICETDNFILDDMGGAKHSEWKEEMLLAFLNHRTSNDMPTLITSNLTHSDLKQKYHERFISRLYAKKNTIIELNGKDRRQS